MKRIAPSGGEHAWPRTAVKSIECRKRDLVIRVADWSRESLQSGEPAFDVECYIGGVYDWDESKTFTLREHGSKAACKQLAIDYAARQIRKLL